MKRAACLLWFLICGACVTPTDVTASSTLSIPAPRPIDLPSEWDSLSLLRFEAWVEQRLPSGSTVELGAEALETLAEALETPGLRAVRAAVVLGRSRCSNAASVLLTQLERRVAAEARSADAADVVSAGALAHFPGDAIARRLEALALEPEPHPDFEVRVECAVSALQRGRDGVAGFLSDVLYLGTPTGLKRGLDLGAPPTTAWGRGRASEALSRHLGIPNPYRTDGPLSERETAADAIANRLRSTYEDANH